MVPSLVIAMTAKLAESLASAAEGHIGRIPVRNLWLLMLYMEPGESLRGLPLQQNLCCADLRVVVGRCLFADLLE